MATEVKVKKWGNSMGVVLPKELVEQERLKENDKLLITVVKEADLNDVFGSLKRPKSKGKPVSAQAMKQFVREGWER